MRFVEVDCVRSFQDDKNEGKIVEVDYEILLKFGMTNIAYNLCVYVVKKNLYDLYVLIFTILDLGFTKSTKQYKKQRINKL
jgi:hypothetical protein